MSDSFSASTSPVTPSSPASVEPDPDFDPDFADYYSSGSKLRTSTFELLHPDEEEQVFQDEDDGEESDSDAAGLYEDYDSSDDDSDDDDDGGDADGAADDGTGPRTSVKRTMSRRGALAHHGSQYMMGTCDAAVFNTLRRTDGTEEYEKLPAGTQIRYHYYTSPRKRCRVTVEYQDPYDESSHQTASPPPPFVDEASDLLESCRLGGGSGGGHHQQQPQSEENSRGMPRRRTDSFTSNVSCHSSSSSSVSFHLDRSSNGHPFGRLDRPIMPHRSADNFLSVST